MFEEDVLCPECEYEHAKNILKDNVTGEIAIEFFCDQAGEDVFHFQLLTGLTDDDIAEFTKIGKTVRKEMTLRLVQRKSEEEAIQEIETRRKRELQSSH